MSIRTDLAPGRLHYHSNTDCSAGHCLFARREHSIMVSLDMLLHSSWVVAMCRATLLGVICHQSIRHVEIDRFARELVFASLGAAVALFVGHITSASSSVTNAILRTSSVGAAFFFGLYASMLLYRAFFHRLRHFPGPFAARLSKFYQYVLLAYSNHYRPNADFI